MIVSLWVFFLLGDPLAEDHGTPYVQATASAWEHDRCPAEVEHWAYKQFHERYPGHAICDSGWCRQQVQVMGA